MLSVVALRPTICRGGGDEVSAAGPASWNAMDDALLVTLSLRVRLTMRASSPEGFLSSSASCDRTSLRLRLTAAPSFASPAAWGAGEALAVPGVCSGGRRGGPALLPLAPGFPKDALLRGDGPGMARKTSPILLLKGKGLIVADHACFYKS
ncbi:hypothetical protein STCU_12390 [Strigomonas culicis]|uniref:Uncharacterized protein n=1 Tax=Strigomonas culicis TaxID=28005 RepID=S9UJZ9_9TRYP|nr:hypothetical protein STCU_12390 [Strigomonas culicis]|eukprot:EPY15011.1 hypothetical protein STCU_12390 [Strigomonas culicis]